MKYLLSVMMVWTLMVVGHMEVSAEEVHPGDDFYMYVNKDWIDATRLTHFDPIMDDAVELSSRSTTMLFYDVIDMSEGYLDIETEGMDTFVTLFDLANDWDMRDELGNKPIEPYLETIEGIESIEDFNEGYWD